MQTAIQRRWLALSDTERKLARRKVDWQHNQSQMSDEDRDHAYDCAWAWQDLKLKPTQMRGLEIWSAHKTSDLIISIHRSIWFNLHRGCLMPDPADNHSLVMAAKDMLVQNPGMAPVFTHHGGFIFCNNDDAEAARCFLSQVGDYMGLELSEETIALAFNQAILELDRPIEL